MYARVVGVTLNTKFLTNQCCSLKNSSFEKLPFGHHAHINIAFVLGLIYMLSYVIMEPLVGAIAAALVAIIYLYTGHLVNTEALVLGLRLN